MCASHSSPRKNNKPATCRISFALLALCYFEIIFWTFALLTSVAVPGTVALSGEDSVSHHYLIREKGNLGLAGSVHGREFGQHIDPSVQFEVACLESAQRKENSYIRQLHDSIGFATPERLQPGLSTLRIAAQSVQGVTGLPAPYTGIKAIS